MNGLLGIFLSPAVPNSPAKVSDDPKEKILADLAGTTIEDENGKRFATAKDSGSLSLAMEFATKNFCDPRTLNWAGRDYPGRNPEFALGVSEASLKWMAQGYGFELTGHAVVDVVAHGVEAAELLGKK